MRIRTFAWIAGCMLAVLAGCAQNKFTPERWEMVKEIVDTKEDVEQILGKPETRMDDMWYYQDLDKHYTAQIHFDGEGRVISKEWQDANTGEWKGRNPNADPPPGGEERERRTGTRRIDKD